MLPCWMGWGAIKGRQSKMDNIQEAEEKILLIVILHFSFFLTTKFSSPIFKADSLCLENQRITCFEISQMFSEFLKTIDHTVDK